MMIKIPNEALPFILLQRTGLQRLNFRFLRKLGVSYHPRLCGWECQWRGAAIRRESDGTGERRRIAAHRRCFFEHGAEAGHSRVWLGRVSIPQHVSCLILH